MKRTVSALAFGISFVYLAAASFAAEVQPTAKVTDLAWLSGEWEGEGAPGGSIGYVHWTQPRAGTIGEIVHVVNKDVTTIVELLVIQEQEGSLVIHQQRCIPCSTIVSEPLHMKLTEIGKNTVTFGALDKTTMLQTLRYTRDGDTLIVEGTFPQGGGFKAKSIRK